jgi:hypothetical protein
VLAPARARAPRRLLMVLGLQVTPGVREIGFPKRWPYTGMFRTSTGGRARGGVGRPLFLSLWQSLNMRSAICLVDLKGAPF